MRPAVRGVGVRAVGWSVVITAIVVRPMVILRISNASGIARGRGHAEGRPGLRIRDRSEQSKSRQQQKEVPLHKSTLSRTWTTPGRQVFAKIVNMGDQKKLARAWFARAKSTFHPACLSLSHGLRRTGSLERIRVAAPFRRSRAIKNLRP